MPVSARALVAAFSLTALAFVGGCRKQDAHSATPPQPEQRYTFRAEVVKLPDASHARPQMTLRHEAIPTFRDQAGAVVGMPSMVMPFELAPSIPLDDIGVGDKVEVVLLADWPRATFRLERIHKLPGDTVIDFGTSRVATEATPAPAR